MTGYNLVMDTSQEALVSALASHNLGTMDQDTKILDSRKKMKPLQATNVDSKLTKDQKLKTKVRFCYIFSRIYLNFSATEHFCLFILANQPNVEKFLVIIKMITMIQLSMLRYCSKKRTLKWPHQS